MVPRWPYYRMGGGGGRADFELAMWSPDRAPVVRELSVGLEYSEKCEKIRNPTVGTYCFGRLPDSSPHSGRGRPLRAAGAPRMGSPNEMASWRQRFDLVGMRFRRAANQLRTSCW